MKRAVLGFLLILAACAPIPITKESPQKGFDMHLDAAHNVKDAKPIVHHWCKRINAEIVECLMFDSDKANANLVGVETMIPHEVWSTLSEEQKKEWHNHAEKVKPEQFVDATPEEAAKFTEDLKDTYGRVTYFWNFPKDQYPIISPFLDSDTVTQ